eukprot:306361_1
MLKGLDLMKNKISYFKSGNIIGICRAKNGFKQYNHKTPDYADIKLNVLIKGVKYNVVGEIQFMLKAMMNFKHSAHSLYSIIRRKEFVTDFVKVLKWRNPKRMTFIAASTLDYNVWCDIIVTHQTKFLTGSKQDEIFMKSIFKKVHIKTKEKATIKCFKLILQNEDKKRILAET